MGSSLSSEEERMSKITSSTYNAPTGYFDQALTGRVEEKNLWETDDIELRLESVRRVLAGMAVPPIIWCVAAAIGYQMKFNDIELPSLIGTAGVALAGVSYIGMFLNYTRYNTNLYLYGFFTLGLAAFLLHDCADPLQEEHKVADAAFVLTFAYCSMSLYSLLSFHCAISLYDIKPGPGQCVYLMILGFAALVGVGSESMVADEDEDAEKMATDAGIALISFLWALSSFALLCYAFMTFRRGHDSTIVCYTYIWPLENIYRLVQKCSRAFDEEW